MPAGTAGRGRLGDDSVVQHGESTLLQDSRARRSRGEAPKKRRSFSLLRPRLTFQA
jgi:hypothetical protein